MVPVATLPAAAILMGVGYWIDPNGWGNTSALAAFFIKSGSAIIDNMSVFFIPAGVAIMGCFSMLQAAAAKFAFVCIATTVIVFLATSYTVLFVSWVMAKMGKDTALAPAVEAENAAKSQVKNADSGSTHDEGAGKHHPHTPATGVISPVAGKEA